MLSKLDTSLLLRFVCILALLFNHSTQATFWNWLITNPHGVDFENLGFRQDSPMSSASNHGDRFGHPRDVTKGRLQSATPTSADATESANRSSEPAQQVPCQADRNCPQGFFCDHHYALCRSYRMDRDPCRSDSQCTPGYDCMFGRCTVAFNPGHRGARCNSDRDCLPSLCCARQHGDKTCKPKLKLGHSCFVPDGGLSYWLNELCPCDDGLVCAVTSKVDDSIATIDWLDIWTEQNLLRCVRPQ
uniref:Dickkopf_N domain-containing protein n=1 Tax=Trichuris muris TaxID=70415 RepID=A0A5S6QNZ4_TRIMR